MSVIGDYTTPLDRNGAPAYLPDWLFLLGTTAVSREHSLP